MSDAQTTVLERLASEIAVGEVMDRQARLPFIPPPTEDVRELTRCVRAIKQVMDAREGYGSSTLEETLTLRKLIELGVQIQVGDTMIGNALGQSRPPSTTVGFPVDPPGYIDPRPVLTSAPLPTNLTVQGAIQTIFISWDLIDYQNHAYVEVYRSTTNNLATATKQGNSLGLQYVDTTAAADTDYWYFVRAVAVNPSTGAPMVGNFTTGAMGKRAKVDVADFASGLEPVAIVNALPNPVGYTGPKVVFLTTDGKLYRYTGSGWTSAVPTADLVGTIVGGQVADGAINTAKFALGIEPVSLVPALPNPVGYTGPKVVFLTTDGKLYRYTGSGWTSAVPAVDLTGQITTVQISDNAISAPKIAANAVTAGKIAANAVTANEIAANAIVAGKVAAGAINTAELAAGAVNTAKLAAGAVTANEIAANAVTAGKIAADAVTADKIAANAVTAGKIAANAVTAGTIAAGAVTATEIAAGAITTAKIGAEAVTATQIAAGTITGDRIAAATIAGDRIQANTITASNIQAGSITGNRLQANTITAGQIAANTITAGQIAANTITGDRIAGATITADKMSVTSLSAITATIGTLRTATSGARVEIADNVIRVFDGSGVLRVKIGNLAL